MIHADNDHELITGYFGGDQYRVVDGALDEADFGKSFMDGRCHLRRVADTEAQIDRRMGTPEGNEVSRQPIAGDCLARVDRKRAALQTAQLGQDQLGRLSPGQDAARLVQEEHTRLGKLDASADAMEQLCAVPRFQGGNRRADG